MVFKVSFLEGFYGFITFYARLLSETNKMLCDNYFYKILKPFLGHAIKEEQ